MGLTESKGPTYILACLGSTRPEWREALSQNTIIAMGSRELWSTLPNYKDRRSHVSDMYGNRIG